MHLRINLPNWSLREFAAGCVAISGLSGQRQRCRLLEELRRFAPDWEPALTASARDALARAIQMLGLAGKRIAVPAYVCPAVLTAIQHAHAHAAPVDVQGASFRFHEEQLANALRERRIDAVIGTNTYGADQDYSWMRAHDVPVIEDAAYQAGRFDARAGSACGLRAALGVWSFNFKSLTGVGGGVLWRPRLVAAIERGERRAWVRDASRFASYATRSALGRHIPRLLPGAAKPGAEDHLRSRGSLGNVDEGEMSELQAGVALAQWGRRDELFPIQDRHIKRIRSALVDSPFRLVGDESTHFPRIAPILIPQSTAVKQAVLGLRRLLHSRGIQTEPAYPVPIEWRSVAPNAADLADRLVLAPCNDRMSDRDVDRLIDVLLSEDVVGIVSVTQPRGAGQ